MFINCLCTFNTIWLIDYLTCIRNLWMFSVIFLSVWLQVTMFPWIETQNTLEENWSNQGIEKNQRLIYLCRCVPAGGIKNPPDCFFASTSDVASLSLTVTLPAPNTLQAAETFISNSNFLFFILFPDQTYIAAAWFGSYSQHNTSSCFQKILSSLVAAPMFMFYLSLYLNSAQFPGFIFQNNARDCCCCADTQQAKFHWLIQQCPKSKMYLKPINQAEPSCSHIYIWAIYRCVLCLQSLV